jgi:hypothetical protein
LRRTLLFALGGFLVPAIVALVVLGARADENRSEGLETFDNVNFPFDFSYPEEFSAASARGDVPALSLEGPNAITVQRIEPPVPPEGLPAYVAQLLVDEGVTAHEVSRSRIEMVTARIPRDLGGRPAESLLYFFSARGGTFQVDCQFTDGRRRQVVRPAARVERDPLVRHEHQPVPRDDRHVALRGHRPVLERCRVHPAPQPVVHFTLPPDRPGRL